MIAFVREVSPSLERCELTHLSRAPIDLKLAQKQHAKFVSVLQELGVTVESLPPLPEQPDGVFVEDAAFVLPELAVIARPGVASRQPEIDSVAARLGRYRVSTRISPPATLEGGDVLRVGHTVFVGITGRTNREGAAEFAEIVEKHGYKVQTVEVRDCVHLKTACTFVPPHFLAVNPAWVDQTAFSDFSVMTVDPSEPFAANTLTVGGTTLVSAACPKLEQKLRAAGITTRRVELSEFHKAEAGISSLALLIEPKPVRPRAHVGLRVVPSSGSVVAENVFASAIVHGGLVYVSEQLPLDPATGEVVAGDIEAQTDQALRNLGEALSASSSGLRRVLRLTCYLADPKMADRVAAVCARVFNGHRPAGSIVAAKMPRAGCLIALDAIAAIIEES